MYIYYLWWRFALVLSLKIVVIWSPFVGVGAWHEVGLNEYVKCNGAASGASIPGGMTHAASLKFRGRKSLDILYNVGLM